MSDDALRAQLRELEGQRVNEALVRLVYESLADVIYLLLVEADDRYRFLSVNRAFLQTTGLRVEQVVGKHMDEVLPGTSRELVRARYRQAIREKRLVAWEETAAYPAGEKVGQVTVQPIFDDRGRCTHLLGSVHDITELRSMQDQLDQARRLEAIGQLAGGIAHDFNNLLSVILSLSEMGAHDLGPDHPQTANLLEIRKAGLRAAEMTEQLLGFSRRQLRKPRILNLNDVLRDLDEMIRRLIREDVLLDIRPGPDLGSVEMDPGQVEQVIVNLVVNARDAMPSGGRLTVETANVRVDGEPARRDVDGDVKPGAYVMLVVSDTGIGMDAETKRRVFEPFFTTKGTEGTGLGLSTVFGIVKQNRGHVRVRSEPGHGATFEIYLPQVELTGTDRGSEDESVAKAPGSETILLVEDDDEVRSIATEILARKGYRVIEARDGTEALSRCSDHPGPIHLLLTDVIMPGMSGEELAQQVSCLRPDTAVLYMSGYSGGLIDRPGVVDVDQPVVDKPITPSKLLNRVREVLDASAAEARRPR